MHSDFLITVIILPIVHFLKMVISCFLSSFMVIDEGRDSLAPITRLKSYVKSSKQLVIITYFYLSI